MNLFKKPVVGYGVVGPSQRAMLRSNGKRKHSKLLACQTGMLARIFCFTASPLSPITVSIFARVPPTSVGAPQCFNPEHIVDENIQLNNRRKGCLGVVTCPDHGHLVVDLCEHTPRCIKPNPPNANCCLSRRLALVEDRPPSTARPTISALDGHASLVRPPSTSDHLPLLSEDSSPVRDGRHSAGDIQNFLALDPSLLPGSDRLPSSTSGGASLADEFVVGDDVVEFETQLEGEFPYGF
jgi:hypothetical protein